MRWCTRQEPPFRSWADQIWRWKARLYSVVNAGKKSGSQGMSLAVKYLYTGPFHHQGFHFVRGIDPFLLEKGMGDLFRHSFLRLKDRQSTPAFDDDLKCFNEFRYGGYHPTMLRKNIYADQVTILVVVFGKGAHIIPTVLAKFAEFHRIFITIIILPWLLWFYTLCCNPIIVFRTF